jgi:hypothetical protein
MNDKEFELEIENRLKKAKLNQQKLIEKRIQENKMDCGISWKECKNRFLNVARACDRQTLDAWNYFKSIYEDIPQEHRLKIQLICIYTDYHYDPYEFYELLNRSLEEETEEQLKTRIKNNKKTLKDYLIKEKFGNRTIDYTIKLYRGMNKYSTIEELALSYTVKKEIAEWFANRFDMPEATVIEREFSINDVIFYTNERKEEEVIVIPFELENFDLYL